ncbi:hypothetical protein [Geothrix paludis]|uniref:hypothetical protein n=1 Tax=Geothrix paludis TaxID=2922722 RepID=UPI001FABA4D6|nr:hypothetical protein [Geothrix paludis]
MNQSKARKEIAALRDAALEDLAKTTDLQLRQEALEAGEDLGAIAAHMRAVMRGAAASVHRQRLVQAREQMEAQARAHVAPVARPTLGQIKQIIQTAFARNPALGLAYREGKNQPDDDWLSLYDDLVALGEIKTGDHER